MVLKTCQLCDRKFTKTEHFKRHQRSHTKERPYECQTCQKRFSRSDVLYRHTKLHQDANDQSPVSNMDPALYDGQSYSQDHSKHHDETPSDTLYGNTMPARTTSDLETQLPHEHDTYNAQIHPHLRQMSQPIASSGYEPGQPMMPHQAPAAVAPPALMMHHRQPITGTSGFSPPTLPPSHSFQQHLSPGNMQGSIDTPSNVHPPMNTLPPLRNESSRQSITDADVESPYQIKDFDGNSDDMLQFWLSQADNAIDFSMLHMPEFGGPFHHQTESSSTSRSSPGPGVQSRPEPIIPIPEARFARVEDAWRSPLATSHSFQNLWKDLVESPATNIFCCGRARSEQSDGNRPNESRWGVTVSVRNQLKAKFGTRISTSGRGTGSADREPHQSSHFPPTEALDMALDIYFRDIHPKAPFIHLPTFQASATPPALLFIMIVLALSTMSTGSGNKFVKKAFFDLRHQCLEELVAAASVGTPKEERLCAFAASLLTLQLAATSADVESLAAGQALYSMLISIAIRQGIFSAGDATSADFPPENASSFERWTAWARVESVRRLIVCLLSTDWWWANGSCASPLIRPEALQITLPADDELFVASSAEEWVRRIQAGSNLQMPTIKPRGFHLQGCLDSVLTQPNPVQPFTMYSLLTIIKHMVSDTQHRYFAQLDDWNGLDRLVPWKTYRHDFRAGAFVSMVVQLAQAATLRRHSDLNVAVLWHNLNINLTANIQIFELAAGRCGALRGMNALSDVAEWSKTAAARRAVLHAAHTCRLLSERKISDKLKMNCLSATFAAALILALFVFQYPQTEAATQATPFELMGDVDWTLIGDCGLTDATTDTTMYDTHQRTPASDFVKFGGPILLNGRPTAGYVSARRLLLDFAHLLDAMDASKPKFYSRILHIMSDVLEDGG